ncbi:MULTISPECIES: amidohydrolase [unclassified Crossiella]|uniref:amidohydrolase family protein n=1 Tax=unclassified Crossiella TaxID=2620835 RepID=UPI001FFEE060|nr:MULTISPECIES: amidohydrolase family protein [unclassified Crossiella]MCK2244169.1 amidohydrolase family protein [Crossiella sp. S99.2]MCK2257973.1 amidohydrolase family protein [Crossiella sp. S99.1]
MIRVDAHAHVFQHGLTLAARRRYTPTGEAPWPAYLRLLDEHGIDRALLVQPSFLGVDNSYLLTAIAAQPERFRGVVVLDTADPRSAARELPALHRGGVRGLRLNLIGQPPPALDGPGWPALGERLAELGWHLEVQATGEQWTYLAAALRNWPGAVVLDHLGLPQADPDWRLVLDLAAHPHIWVKISGLYRSPAGAVAAGELCAVIGPDRLVWGSDWPWTRFEPGRDYRALIEEARGLLPGAADRLLGGNAGRLLGWL